MYLEIISFILPKYQTIYRRTLPHWVKITKISVKLLFLKNAQLNEEVPIPVYWAIFGEKMKTKYEKCAITQNWFVTVQNGYHNQILRPQKHKYRLLCQNTLRNKAMTSCYL